MKSPFEPSKRNIQVMEQEIKKKRGREEEEMEEYSSNKSTKVQADHLSRPHSVTNDIKIERRSCNHEEDNNISNTSYEISGDNNFALGVFDFPWLKEGSSSMISKADEEEWCLEDTIFSSSLHYSTTSATEFSGQRLWETTPEATCIESCIDVPVDKFEEINAWSLEMEATVD